jgi:AcrR family transcriptional regulator
MVAAAGKIINESGINSLSIEELAREMKIDHSLLNPYLKKDDDILVLILLSLETEIKQLINNTRSSDGTSEEELRLLFENMHKLLKIKQYYLSVIFFIESKEMNSELQNALLRIKISVKAFLLEVINHGKEETVFKTKLASGSLVNNILGSFRSFMNEQRLINKMINDLEILKIAKD